MRERTDFHSISKIILDNLDVNGLSKPEYIQTLFFYAFEQTEYKIAEPDTGDISRYIQGQRGIPKEIIRLYQENGNIKFLEQGMAKVLSHTTDPDYIIQQIIYLLEMDTTISETKKESLQRIQTNPAKFLAECLMFGMSRKFIRAGNGGQSHSSFALEDFLLNPHLPYTSKVFIGREHELTELHSRLNQCSKIFLEGIGGIGKSELAKQYAKAYRSTYQNVLYLYYNENLKHTIADLNFIDDTLDMTEEERFRRHYRLFQMLDENTLVILDNFDVTADREELLHEFLSFSFPLLVTTRIHFEDVEVYPVCEIQSKSKLLELFYTYAPCTASKKEAVILDIIDEVYRHTLTVEMAAKTLKASALEPEELLTALKEHGIQHMDTDKIGVTKDSHRKTDSMYRHLEILFRIQNLSKEKVNHLRYLALVDDKGIEKATFKTWLQLSDLNDINELIENGWVRTDATETCILLHPLIREMINAFEKPTFENCMPFFLGMSVPLFQRQVGFDSSCEVLSVLKNSCKYILPDSKDAFTNLMQFATEYIVDYLNQCVSLDELPPRESVIYYLLWGGITLHRKEYKIAEQHFLESISHVQPIEKKIPELAANLYYDLGICELNQYAQSVKESQCDKHDYKKGIAHIDYALELRAASVSSGRQQALPVDIKYIPLGGNADYAKLAISDLVEKWKNHENLLSSIWELYRILGELDFQTESYSKANDWFSRAKLYYLKINAPDSSTTKQLESKILESHKLADGEESCL